MKLRAGARAIHQRLCRWALSLAFAAVTPLLLAHPMGNFSVNHYSAIKLSQERIELRYIIDMAEIPTFQELQATGINADPQDSRIPNYLSVKAEKFWHGIVFKVDDRPVNFKCAERQVMFPPGAGGLPTMRLAFTCNAALPRLRSGLHRVQYRDGNFPGRAGWKEVIIDADPPLQLISDVPRKDRSAELSNYSADLLNSPPQDLGANASFTVPPLAATGKIAPAQSFAEAKIANPNVATKLPPDAQASAVTARETPQSAGYTEGTPRSAFTQLMVSHNPSVWFLIGAAVIAIGLGALHALEPGHGKTLVAAYLVGSRGTAWHAVSLGLIVTLAHTAGVYAIGAVTLYAARYILPEKLYPWLGMVSGLMILGLGMLLLMRRWAAEHWTVREDHRHWYDSLVTADRHSIPGSSGAAAVPALEPVSTRQLLLLGITGGLVPCPAALVVLLSAVGLHRIAFGFFLIVAFSAGLAAVLIASGLLAVHVGKHFTRLVPKRNFISRRLPQVSAGFIAIIGGALIVQSVTSAGLAPRLQVLLSPKWLLVAGIGLLLGMRHSTDPDHVIAVTTIVTRLRTLRHASFVGLLWGVGHTLTIFIVGAAIILFDIVIPPRLGLSMEFAVALMLILLGVLNLTGVLAWFTARYAPSATEARSNSERLFDRTLTRFGAYHLFRPLIIGIVHGLAGSAAVALLVLATIHNTVGALGYLLLFGVGTIAGMMLMTAVIAMPVVWTSKNFARLNRYMCATSGVVSLAFGLFLVYQIGFVSGLFSEHLKWIPQ